MAEPAANVGVTAGATVVPEVDVVELFELHERAASTMTGTSSKVETRRIKISFVIVVNG
jgi:hypothetical protein